MMTTSDDIDENHQGNNDTLISNKAPTPHGIIDENGVCLSCNDPHALEIYLACFWCDCKLHAVCRDAIDEKMVDKKHNDIICTRSFFNTYKANTDSQVYQKRPHSFVVLCDVCETELEIKKSTTQQNKVEQLDVRVDALASNVGNLSSDVTSIKEMLEQVISNQPNSGLSPGQLNPSLSPQPPQTSTNTCNVWDDPDKIKNMITKATMIIDKSPDNSNSKQDLENLVVQNGIHVNKIYQNRAGKTVVELPTQSHRSNLAEKLNETQVKFTNQDDLLPTISIANMEGEPSRDDLLDKVLQSHPEIKSLVDKGGTFSILNIRKQNKNDKFQANVRVSNNIRQFIEIIGDRLYIGLQSCKVHDHFFVKRCNNCQKFGHYVSECKAQKPTCGICASEDHQTKDCAHSSIHDHDVCANCKTSKNPALNQNANHRAFDINCGSYKQAQAKLKESILYYSSKN